MEVPINGDWIMVISDGPMVFAYKLHRSYV